MEFDSEDTLLEGKLFTIYPGDILALWAIGGLLPGSSVRRALFALTILTMSSFAFLIYFNLRCSSFDSSTLSDVLEEDVFDGVVCFLLTAGVIVLLDVLVFVQGEYFIL
jgi:hypothetical protein